MTQSVFLLSYDGDHLAVRVSRALLDFAPFYFAPLSRRDLLEEGLAEATLVLIDARQRERDWPAIAELLRGLVGQKTVGVLTAVGDEDELRFFAGCGVTAFLDCQASVEELLAWLRQLLEKKTEGGAG